MTRAYFASARPGRLYSGPVVGTASNPEEEVTKSASEVMHDVIVAAVIDGLGALRTASKGVPNALLRDLGAIHPNTTFQDLPAELQASIQTSVRAAFTRLQSEGYTVLNPKVAGVAPRPQPRPTGGPGRGPGGGGGRPGAPRDPRRPRPDRPPSGKRPPRS
ncbi:hypothetical protein SAMN06295920_106266 [Rhizorhabdus histidinilytica]|jgi:hypothetical protein|uniref:Uncharacterized protein n=1 Tax=Rhizorhabdus histidinilytica TaxID=439228 RepID=A0A1T5E879_9SPHN|nr:hypothetical protein SAMN06295920_106266 [Rhizorhabdus histidinilytica]